MKLTVLVYSRSDLRHCRLCSPIFWASGIKCP